MSKRTIKTTKAAFWITSLVLCCLIAALFMGATQTGEHKAQASLGREPDTTGSIETARMKWCGVAPWCR